METVENKYITVAYKLYTVEDGEKELFEETNAEHPFQFISGLGTTLESFENQITALSKGDKFDFTIPADEAYGAYDEQHVFDLPKNIKPYCVLPIGYSAVEINQKDRYDESRIHKEIYN